MAINTELYKAYLKLQCYKLNNDIEVCCYCDLTSVFLTYITLLQLIFQYKASSLHCPIWSKIEHNFTESWDTIWQEWLSAAEHSERSKLGVSPTAH